MIEKIFYYAAEHPVDAFHYFFALICLVVWIALYLLRNQIFEAFEKYPLRKRALKIGQVLIPSLFSILASFWFKHPQVTTQAAIGWVIVPFTLVFGSFLFLIYSAEEQILKRASDSISSRNEEKALFDLQIRKLRQIVSLEEHLQHLIKAKAKRFLKFYQDHKTSQPIRVNVFNEITQPQEQIKTIVFLAHEYFKRYIVIDGHQCHVHLMCPNPEDSNRLMFQESYPEPPKSVNKSIYAYGKSAAGKAWQKRDMIIIADKEAALREPDNGMYIRGERSLQEDKGSLICYPVFDYEATTNVKEALIYVININSSAPNNFNVIDQAHYDKILKSLGERLILENRLARIKSLKTSSGE